MKAYHTYNSVDVAFCLLEHADKQGKRFTNLQLQKLTYVCHGLSLAYYDRPLIIDNVYAWQYGPVVPSVYFRFKRFGANAISEPASCIDLDHESEEIIDGVVEKLGDLSGPQLVELTHREGSPWSKVWEKNLNKVIPDSVIQEHYQKIIQTGRTDSL